MTREELTAKLAEAKYLKRMREEEWGCAKYDWYYAECAIRFFEKESYPHNEWWEKEYEDFKFLEPLYNQLVGDRDANNFQGDATQDR